MCNRPQAKLARPLRVKRPKMGHTLYSLFKCHICQMGASWVVRICDPHSPHLHVYAELCLLPSFGHNAIGIMLWNMNISWPPTRCAVRITSFVYCCHCLRPLCYPRVLGVRAFGLLGLSNIVYSALCFMMVTPQICVWVII